MPIHDLLVSTPCDERYLIADGLMRFGEPPEQHEHVDHCRVLLKPDRLPVGLHPLHQLADFVNQDVVRAYLNQHRRQPAQVGEEGRQQRVGRVGLPHVHMYGHGFQDLDGHLWEFTWMAL